MSEQTTTSDDLNPEPEFKPVLGTTSTLTPSKEAVKLLTACKAMDTEPNSRLMVHWHRKKASYLQPLNGWRLVRIDVSNATFIHGDLFEKVYMQMPQGYVGQGACTGHYFFYFGLQIKEILVWSKTGTKTMTTLHLTACSVLLMIANTGSSTTKIQHLKSQLSSHFHMKDLGELNYFLGLEICKSEQGIFISQKKYTLDLLTEAGLSNAKSYKLPMDSHVKLQADMGTPLPDP
ncbi:retrovirus-related pol polyprotein from transposon TNT 1-94 [Tanacetum coccineum]|uniref:Retrovirus-related pol polyprotein from transposon TNT 1-94 n=1 Tax=Tanacetum coccineum TaxID=301880 RepID=A0ABQ5ASY7_9ASTR